MKPIVAETLLSEHPTQTSHAIGRKIRVVRAGLNIVFRGFSYFCKKFWKFLFSMNIYNKILAII